MSKQTKQSYVVSKAVEVMKYIINRVENPSPYNVVMILYCADKIHLKKYGKLIIPSQYIKEGCGPTHELCNEIIEFIGKGKTSTKELIDQCVKQEIELFFIEDKEFKDNIDYRLRSLTKVDFRYLAKINIECLDEAIEKYGKCNSTEIERICYDDIFRSVKSRIITIVDMANILDPSGELTEEVNEIYPLLAI